METGSPINSTDSNKKISYRLHDKLKNVFPSKDGSLTNTCKVILAILFICFMILALITLPIAEIIVGSLGINQCPVEPRIPIYLIMTGIAILILFILTMMQILFDKAWYLIILNILIALFMVAWLITGFIWTYNASYKVQYYDDSRSNYCDYGTFRLATVTRFLNFAFLISIMRSCTSTK